MNNKKASFTLKEAEKYEPPRESWRLNFLRKR